MNSGGAGDEFDYDDYDVQCDTEMALLQGMTPGAFVLVQYTTRPDEDDWQSDDEGAGDIHDWSYEQLLALDDAVHRRGLPAEKMARLQRTTLEHQPDEESRTCAVCHEDYADKDVLVRLPCGHYFHVGRARARV